MRHAKLFAAEFIGTFLLLVVGVGIGFSEAGSVLGLALALGFTVMVVSALVGPVSGAHINPAVTIGLALARKVDLDKVPTYLVAQFLGGIGGAFVAYVIARGRDGGFSPDESNFGISGWESIGGYDWFSMIIAVSLLTSVVVAIYVATRSRDVSGPHAALAGGLAYTVTTLVGVGVVGVSVNPALSFGTAIFAGGDAMTEVWLVMLFAVVGAVLGVLCFLAIDDSSLEDTMLGQSALARKARDMADTAFNKTASTVSGAAGKVGDVAGSVKDKVTGDDD
jgi:aquaporin Z